MMKDLSWFSCPLCVTAASGGTAYACQLAMAVLRHPTGQVLFATWFAALAGLAAWYLMWSSRHLDALLLWERERQRERGREGERERTARRLGNPLNLWTSFRHSFLLQVYLMLHVCLKVSWQEINLWMIHRTIRHNLHPYIHPFLKLVTVYPPAFLYHYLLHTVQFTYSSVFDGILTLVVSVFWFFCHEKTSLSCWFVVIWHFPLNFNETERARWLLDRYTMLKLVKNEERILVSWNILCKCCALV